MQLGQQAWKALDQLGVAARLVLASCVVDGCGEGRDAGGSWQRIGCMAGGGPDGRKRLAASGRFFPCRVGEHGAEYRGAGQPDEGSASHRVFFLLLVLWTEVKQVRDRGRFHGRPGIPRRDMCWLPVRRGWARRCAWGQAQDKPGRVGHRQAQDKPGRVGHRQAVCDALEDGQGLDLLDSPRDGADLALVHAARHADLCLACPGVLTEQVKQPPDIAVSQGGGRLVALPERVWDDD